MTYQHKKTAFADSEKGSTTFSLAIIFGLFFLSVLYLAEINGVVAKNFELRSIRNSLKEKQDANQQITVSLMRVQSLVNLEGAAKNMNLVTVDKVGYLKIIPDSFAFLQQP